MKNVIALTAFFLISHSVHANVNTIQLGSAIDRLNQIEYGDIEVKGINVNAISLTKDSNPKILGRWKRCFTRVENVPPMPLQKYIYQSITEQFNVDKFFKINNTNKTIEVNEERLIDIMTSLEKKLKAKTESKCELETRSDVNLKVYVKELKQSFDGRFLLEDVDGKLQITFGEWKPDMSGVVEIKEFLPNKTPYNLSFPY